MPDMQESVPPGSPEPLCPVLFASARCEVAVFHSGEMGCGRESVASPPLPCSYVTQESDRLAEPQFPQLGNKSHQGFCSFVLFCFMKSVSNNVRPIEAQY